MSNTKTQERLEIIQLDNKGKTERYLVIGCTDQRLAPAKVLQLCGAKAGMYKLVAEVEKDALFPIPGDDKFRPWAESAVVSRKP